RLEFAEVGVEGGGFEGPDEGFASVCRINDGVDPKAGGGVARIGLVFVGGADGVVQILLLLFVDFFSGALKLLDFDFYKSARGGVAAHDGVTRGGPGKNEARVVGFAAHGVVTGAETAAADDGNLGYHGVGHRVDHFCASTDDAAPLGVLADHETV